MLANIKHIGKGIKKEAQELGENRYILFGFLYSLIAMIPLFEWAFIPGRTYLYNILNTVFLPFIVLIVIASIYLAFKSYEKSNIEVDAASEFVGESGMKLKFMPSYLKIILRICALLLSFFGSFYFFLSTNVEYTFLKEIIFVIVCFSIVYVPVIILYWIIDFVRHR